MEGQKELIWHEVLDDVSKLHEDRVMTVFAGHRQICLTNFEGKISALDNRCPHQGGPLGEGSIEKGWLRCPWHGWDFHPCTGLSPGAHEDGLETFEVKIEDNKVLVATEAEKEHERTISDVMVETMINWGVNVVFGMVGHSNLGFADAMRRAEARGDLKYYGIRHEGAGAFAASAYGKLTGKPAACFAIAGPGATNMFTGMWDAKVDRAPLLALSGQVATQVVGTGNFQEVDLVRAFQTVAEFNHRVQQDSRHASLMSLAIKHAILKRDVSHLTFPDEIQEAAPPAWAKTQDPNQRITSQKIAPPQEDLSQAVEMIAKAKRPLIVVGHGSRFDREALKEFAERLNCPVVTTFKGKGIIEDSHPLAGGVLGRSGTPIASYFMNEADLLIVLGASFSNHTGISPKLPTIQIDFDPLALSKFHKIDCALWGEISVSLELINAQLKEIVAEDQRAEIAQRWAIWREEKERRLTEVSSKGLSSIAVFDALNRFAPDNAVMCVDVGNNAYSFGRYFEAKPGNDFLMSGYLGSIGFALPAALGAAAATEGKKPIIAVAGDGGLAQYLADFTTSIKYGFNIKLILLNNSELGKISKEQRAGEFDVWKTKLHNPDFAQFAASAGAWSARVEHPDELDAAMKALMEEDNTGLLEIITDALLV